MFKRWKIVLLVAFVGLIVGVGFWRWGSFNDPEQILVGVWDVELEPPRVEGKWQADPSQVTEDMLNLPEEATKEIAAKLNSTERLTFKQNGEFTIVTEILGLTCTTEGTWKARSGKTDQAAFTILKKKMTVLKPDGETKEHELNLLSEWVVSRSEGGKLKVSISEPEKGTRECKLRRAEN